MDLQEFSPGMSRGWRRERRLALALGVSMLLHAALLLPPSWARLTQFAARAPLVVSLRTPALPAEQAEVATPPAAPHQPVAATAVPPPQETPPRAAVVSAPAAPAPPALPPAASLAPASTPATAAPREAASPPARAEASLAAVAQRAAEPGPLTRARADEELPGLDADALRDYRFALARSVVTRYPRQAVERGLEGTARIQLALDAQGLPARVSVLASSGHALLDAQAREMIAGAARRAALPQALRGREFAVDMPVRFDLREAEADF